MRPDAIPVRAMASRAVLPPDAIAALFGPGARLGPTARVTLVRLGRAQGQVAVVSGAALAVTLDRSMGDEGAVRLQGPVGVVGPVETGQLCSRLVLPDGLRRAWNVGESATLALGPLALAVPVASGPEARAEIERAAWLAAGRPETARWLPGVAWERDPETPDPGAQVVERRVVTETDVRQARLRRQRIRLGPGQIVTPAARSLAREWDVFED